MSDPFAELFRALRVKGAVYFAHDFAAPWGLAMPRRPHAQFHVALAGACIVEGAGRRFRLAAREVALFPNGAAHTISDGGGELQPGRDVVQAIRAGEAPFAGAAVDVRLLSGHFEFDRGARHPLLQHLPEVVHMPDGQGLPPELDGPLYTLASAEAGSRLPGAETVVERLAEIFLVQALRAQFARGGPLTGLLGVLFDPRLGAGMAAMHARWAEPLTLAELGRAAGMSRSAFASAFRAAAGITPMAYLARWRLLKGRELLNDPALSVAQVAAACGHRSTEGFSRAFSRTYGASPSAVRRRSSDLGPG